MSLPETYVWFYSGKLWYGLFTHAVVYRHHFQIKHRTVHLVNFAKPIRRVCVWYKSLFDGDNPRYALYTYNNKYNPQHCQLKTTILSRTIFFNFQSSDCYLFSFCIMFSLIFENILLHFPIDICTWMCVCTRVSNFCISF